MVQASSTSSHTETVAGCCVEVYRGGRMCLWLSLFTQTKKADDANLFFHMLNIINCLNTEDHGSDTLIVNG